MNAVLFLIFGVAAASGASPQASSIQNPSTEFIRDWTDASGTHHARAALVGVDGEILWFRSADGRLTSASVSRLSESDQQYVADHPPTNTDTDIHGSESPVSMQSVAYRH